MTLYHDGMTSLSKFETFLQRLLWENAFGAEVVVFRLKAEVALEDGRKVLIQVDLQKRSLLNTLDEKRCSKGLISFRTSC